MYLKGSRKKINYFKGSIIIAHFSIRYSYFSWFLSKIVHFIIFTLLKTDLSLEKIYSIFCILRYHFSSLKTITKTLLYILYTIDS